MHVLILGSRGIPAKYGGFETFAQDFALFLAARNHEVTVYCQGEAGTKIHEDEWNGIRRVLVPSGDGSKASIGFDLACVIHAAKTPGVVLTLGYNTGIFNFIFKALGKPNVMNMDGVEWRRKKWGKPQRFVLWANEWLGARASQHLVADHPEIVRHLRRHTSPSKITMIPYGADRVCCAPIDPVSAYGLTAKAYDLVIARPLPENAILEIVQAHGRSRRPYPLVVLGNYLSATGQYERTVVEAAGPNVMFLGPVYDRGIVRALRFHSRLYLHGHRVGGTNPSLVESLAAGTAVVAHNNRYNRWVAGCCARYFNKADDLAKILDCLDADPHQLQAMEMASRRQFEQQFANTRILGNYEKLLMKVAAAKEPQPLSSPRGRRWLGIFQPRGSVKVAQ